MLAVGRDADKLKLKFSNSSAAISFADYDQLGDVSRCHTLVNLAVYNNDREGTLHDFAAVNVDFAEYVASEFIRMQGVRFLNVSSILTLVANGNSPYTVSKAIADDRLIRILGSHLDTVYIGYFYDHDYFGERLRFLSNTGPKLGGALFSFFKILKPTTSAAHLARYFQSPPIYRLSPSILTDNIGTSFLYRMTTRILDIGVALFVLALLWPLMVALTIAIRIDSAGPAIFRQERVGVGLEPFTLYKFRTMRLGTIITGTHQVSPTAITKIGHFLRRTKLDELPQAFNLLRGEMTLVGPRPCLFSQKELIEARNALGVYEIKPGITGYSQIREIDMSQPALLARSDYVYKEIKSLLLNFQIVLRTAIGGGSGDRVPSVDRK